MGGGLAVITNLFVMIPAHAHPPLIFVSPSDYRGAMAGVGLFVRVVRDPRGPIAGRSGAIPAPGPGSRPGVPIVGAGGPGASLPACQLWGKGWPFTWSCFVCRSMWTAQGNRVRGFPCY